MRDILFRGVRSKDNRMVEGLPHFNAAECCFQITEFMQTSPTMNDPCGNHWNVFHDIKHETLGEFSGMTDTAGGKIFEGDIIRVSDFNSLYVVIFQNGCFKLQHLSKDMTNAIWGTLERIKELEHKYPFVVVGNIHENTELL